MSNAVRDGGNGQEKTGGARIDDPRIVNEDYDPGVPGRACTVCNMAWPADEDDGAYWHHRDACEVAS